MPASIRYDETGFALGPDGTRLFWGRAGVATGGPTIVLCDGIGCDGFAWRYLHPDLAKDHDVVHWHYRGHGRSGPPRDRTRLVVPALAEDLRAVLDATGVDRAVLFGHSMGTQVILEALRSFPERVRALVLVCGSYGKVTQTFHGSDMLHNVLPALVEAVKRNHGLARAIWGRVPAKLAYRIAGLSKEIDALAIREEDFHWYWEHVGLMDPDVFLPLLQAAGEHSAEDMLADVRVPTLVVAAERDMFIPCQLSERLAQLVTNAQLHVIRGGTHAAPIEQPTLILEHVRAFLSELADEPVKRAG